MAKLVALSAKFEEPNWASWKIQFSSFYLVTFSLAVDSLDPISWIDSKKTQSFIVLIIL